MVLVRVGVVASRWRQTSFALRRYSTAHGGSIDAARTHCTELLRKFDVPSFLLRSFVPPASRDAFIALQALNIDVARVADTTSHPTIGAVRMQFWRDAVDKALAGSPPKEPAALLLSAVAENLESRSQGRSRLNKAWLHRMITTREQYLGNKPFPSLTALETYSENTYSTLLYLTLSSMPLHSLTVDHLASHIGKAMGIVAVLRGLPLVAFPRQAPTHHTSNAIGGPYDSGPQGAVLLPLDIMAQCRVKEEEIFREGGNAPNLKDAVFTVATRANDHLITAREMLKNLQKGQDVGHEFEHADDEGHAQSAQGSRAVDKQLEEVHRGFGVLMPAVSTSLWLSRLEQLDFDIFDRSLMKTDWKLPFKAYWAFQRKSF